MSEWKECTIGDIGTVVGGATPLTTDSRNYDKGNIPWITPKDLSDYHERYISRGERNITETGLKSCATQMLPKNTVLFSSRAPIGYVAIASNEVCTNQGFKSVVPNKDVDYLFLYYLLKYNKEMIEGMGSGTTFKEVSKKTMEQIKVCVPKDISVQRKIAGILDSLDSKIELNNQINRNLEEQCNIFFEHFIQSHENKLYPLSELILKANTGADAIQRAPIVEYNTGVRCIRVGDLSNKRPFYEWGYAKVSNEDFKRYRLRKGDIVVSRTASLGLNCMISSDLSAVYNNGLIRLSIDTNRALPSIVYRQFQTFDYRNYISRISAETSVRPNMKIDYLLNYSFKIPDLSKQKELAALIEPFFDQQNHIAIENQHLSSLRDYLLPKLMIGEIDTEKISI